MPKTNRFFKHSMNSGPSGLIETDNIINTKCGFISNVMAMSNDKVII